MTVAPVAKLLPLIVMLVSPVVLPCDGETDLRARPLDGAVEDLPQEPAPITTKASRIVCALRRDRDRNQPNKGTVMIIRAGLQTSGIGSVHEFLMPRLVLSQPERREARAGYERAVA